MKVECPECKESEFSVLENRYEEIDYKKGTGRVIKDLSCNCCGAVFLASMDIEINDVDIDFTVTLSKES